MYKFQKIIIVLDIIKTAIKKIKELKDIMDKIQDISVDYIKSSQIYDLFHDEIEKVNLNSKNKCIIFYL